MLVPGSVGATGALMSEKKRKRRGKIVDLVREIGGVSVGALAEIFDVSMQTIRRDVDIICDAEAFRRRHGRIELAEQYLNTPFDQRAGTSIAEKRDIGTAAAALVRDGSTIFISIGSTPLSVARALRERRELTVITNNLSAAMALSEEQSNRIILPGGEVRLPDRDILGDEVLKLFGQYRADFGIFGVAGVTEKGDLLEFHAAEVRARERIRENSKVSLLVLDQTKFGRMAPAVGENILDMDYVILDRRPDPGFEPLLDSLGDRLILAERE